jgi:hypothetical protein
MIEFLAAEFGRDPLLSDQNVDDAELSNFRGLAHASG